MDDTYIKVSAIQRKPKQAEQIVGLTQYPVTIKLLAQRGQASHAAPRRHRAVPHEAGRLAKNCSLLIGRIGGSI